MNDTLAALALGLLKHTPTLRSYIGRGENETAGRRDDALPVVVLGF
jgi:hypothetical protein